MSGTWTDAGGTPRDPNAPTPDDDLYQGNLDDTGLVILPNADAGNDTVIGGGGYNVIGGGPGDDLLVAGPDGGEIAGNEGNDTIRGGAGGDLLTGGDGDDVIEGGDGPDTMVLSGAPENYSWSSLPGGSWTVTDTRTGGEGTDTVSGVERIYYLGVPGGLETDAPCFMEGTRIMTRRGEVPVEALRSGELVLAVGPGGPRFAPIRWIGHRRIDLARHPRPSEAAPIRIQAGALGDGMPVRDLFVSPDHALFLDGALVPAALLADGEAIAPAPWLRRIRYFHVELDCHAVILADGAAAESYREDGNRGDFDNGGLVVALHPSFAPREAGSGAPPCAPIVTQGARLDAIRARLAARRAANGQRSLAG